MRKMLLLFMSLMIILGSSCSICTDVPQKTPEKSITYEYTANAAGQHLKFNTKEDLNKKVGHLGTCYMNNDKSSIILINDFYKETNKKNIIEKCHKEIISGLKFFTQKEDPNKEDLFSDDPLSMISSKEKIKMNDYEGYKVKGYIESNNCVYHYTAYYLLVPYEDKKYPSYIIGLGQNSDVNMEKVIDSIVDNFS